MLRPFSRFCIMIGAIPESIIHSLSYEQQLLRLIKFLKQTVIPAIDGNTTAIQKIEEWIENVDLQEFVDTKLDEMVESGELQEIISEYLNSQAIFGYDTVADMVASTNLINGSYARTMGYYSKNDGGSSLYLIRNITNEDTVDGMLIIAMENNTLIAEKINTESMLNVLELGIRQNIDESIKLQDLIDRGYTNLYFPAGTYKFSITLDEHKFHLKGDAMRTYVEQVSSNLSPINITINENKANYNSIIENFELVGNNDSTANGFNLTGAGTLTQCNFKNVSAVKFYNSLYSSLNFYTNIFENCHFSDSLNSGFTQTGERFFNNNNFISCKFNSNVNYGIDLFCPTGRGLSNLFIECDLENNATPHNNINPTANYAVRLSGGLMNTKFSSCYFENNGKENNSFVSTLFFYNESASLQLLTIDTCSFTYEKDCIKLTNNTKAIHMNNIEKYSRSNAYVNGTYGIHEFIGGSYEHDSSSLTNAIIVDNNRLYTTWREANQTFTVQVPNKKGFVRFYSFSSDYHQIIEIAVSGNNMKVISNTTNSAPAINYTPTYNSDTGTITFTNGGTWGNNIVCEVN